ncbi:MAG TPA: hypothetical protein VFI87_14695 [Hyphomicrobiaceae bacterium]|jgi:hypothetical protein|nr:hypothetical protein [Hyphomicrobiaceae bacterium]
MSWFSGAELLGGVGALALAVFLVGFFRFVPIAGSVDQPPTQMRLTVMPLFILLIVVLGFGLIFRSIGYI